jgi:hypothetical protein
VTGLHFRIAIPSAILRLPARATGGAADSLGLSSKNDFTENAVSPLLQYAEANSVRTHSHQIKMRKKATFGNIKDEAANLFRIRFVSFSVRDPLLLATILSHNIPFP